MNTATFPYLDPDLTITPICVPFLAEHAHTVEIDPNDQSMTIVTFERPEDARALKRLLKVLDAPTDDPTDAPIDGEAAPE